MVTQASSRNMVVLWGYYGDVMNDLGKVNHDLTVLLNPGIVIIIVIIIDMILFFDIIVIIIITIVIVIIIIYIYSKAQLAQMAAGGLIGFYKGFPGEFRDLYGN